MKQKTNKIELLAPAGDFACMNAAINAGANAVYFGISKLNMRDQAAQNFTVKDLPKIANTCHEAGVKCYLALNVLIYDAEIDEMKEVVDAAHEAGIDAIIAFDTSVILYAREIGIDVHISTQHSISNIEAVKFFSEWSDRVVLARELTLEQIANIRDEIVKQNVRGPRGELIEIEDFVHGAMCVSVSGRCGMSLYAYCKSANRGQCFQPCRRAYTVIDKQTKKTLEVDNEFIMSPEDLCTIGLLDEIIDAGVKVLKIEGRGRPPEYVDTVVRCYRQALDAIDEGTYTEEKIVEWNKQLGTVFNRGLSDGFYRGQAFRYWSGLSGNKSEETKELVGTVEHFYPKISVAEVRIHASTLEEGDQCLFTGPFTGLVRTEAKAMLNEEESVKSATQGDVITFVVPGRVRQGDKMYKIVKNTR